MTKPIRILVDVNVRRHAITHQGKWVSTGTVQWSGGEIETGGMAIVPVYPTDSTKPEYQQIRYLVAIAELAMQGGLQFFSSQHLDWEISRYPTGMYESRAMFEYGLFNNLPSIDGSTWEISMCGAQIKPKTSAWLQRHWLKRQTIPLYRDLVSALGQPHSQDAWHIYTAEIYDAFCFLTMEAKLGNMIERLTSRPPFNSLRTKVMTPEQLASQLKLQPVDPSAKNHPLSGFERSELHLEGKRRRPSR